MAYGLLVIVHLFCATIFIGIVTFEVLFLESIRGYLPAPYMSLVEEGIHRRGRQIMPWFVGTLFLSGISMVALAHYPALLAAMDAPLATPFGTLLAIKMLLAGSVLVHFIQAMRHSICGNMTSRRFKYTHLSVFLHMIVIILLARGMFHLQW